MSNYLSPFERWQLATKGNILAEMPLQEEFEYRNSEDRRATEWMEQQAENQLTPNQ